MARQRHCNATPAPPKNYQQHRHHPLHLMGGYPQYPQVACPILEPIFQSTEQDNGHTRQRWSMAEERSSNALKILSHTAMKKDCHEWMVSIRNACLFSIHIVDGNIAHFSDDTSTLACTGQHPRSLGVINCCRQFRVHFSESAQGKPGPLLE